MAIPQEILKQLSPTVRNIFQQWDEFLYTQVRFNRPQSVIHAFGHCERVLLHALLIGEAELGDDPGILTALAHAAVFHDTRRLDDYLDTGHGARSAVYYRDFCNQRSDINFMAEAALMMKYHDQDDSRSKLAITNEYDGANLDLMLKLYTIFKDADALDRWRLGPRGLDKKYLRTEKARSLSEFARELVIQTMPEDIRSKIEDAVEAKWVKSDLSGSPQKEIQK